MKLMRVRLPKSMLLAMPPKERAFFIQFGTVSNELKALLKVVQFSSNVHATQRPVVLAQNFMSMFFRQILAGKLWEGWQFLQKSFFGTQLSKDYDSLLNPLGQKSLVLLKEYFGRKDNLIARVRNDYAFHYSQKSGKRIEDAIQKVRDHELFEVFVSRTHGNCSSGMSSILIDLSIVDWTDTSNCALSLSTLLEEIKHVTEWFLDFFGDCLVVTVKKHVGAEKDEVEISDPPDITALLCPYFVKTQSDPTQEQEADSRTRA